MLQVLASPSNCVPFIGECELSHLTDWAGRTNSLPPPAPRRSHTRQTCWSGGHAQPNQTQHAIFISCDLLGAFQAEVYTLTLARCLLSWCGATGPRFWVRMAFLDSVGLRKGSRASCKAHVKYYVQSHQATQKHDN